MNDFDPTAWHRYGSTSVTAALAGGFVGTFATALRLLLCWLVAANRCARNGSHEIDFYAAVAMGRVFARNAY